MNISWLYEEYYSGRVKAVMVEVTACLPTNYNLKCLPPPSRICVYTCVYAYTRAL